MNATRYARQVALRRIRAGRHLRAPEPPIRCAVCGLPAGDVGPIVRVAGRFEHIKHVLDASVARARAAQRDRRL
jgi:hypothetical protein